MKNIIFVGVKHCGKSTQGRLLARRLQLPFADTDELIAQTYAAENGVPLADAQPRRIVQKHGEELKNTKNDLNKVIDKLTNENDELKGKIKSLEEKM